jgi:predicted house-cleaning noncanonical NTP pyrophosphatase (MazG superfamily)
MRIKYSKLIRDRIPEIIQADGRTCRTETLSEDDYRHALLQKLVEEAQEAADSGPDRLVTELADVFEILDTIMSVYSIHRESVLAEQQRRRSQRGAFHKRLRLLWTE